MSRPRRDPAGAARVDAHCHLASSRCVPRSFVEGIAQNLVGAMEAAGLPASLGQIVDAEMAGLDDHDGDELVAEMDGAGIGETVLLAPDFTYALRDASCTIEEQYVQHARVMARHPGRFRVLAGVDPRWGRDALDLFERGLRELGFSGLKLYPPCGYRVDDASLEPYYELCAARRLPVLLHVGPTSSALSFEEARPEYVDRPARRFPTVPFILAHAASAYSRECANLAAFRPNVYVDVSGFSADPEAVDGAGLRLVLNRGVAHKVLFGTDWPVFRRISTISACLEKFSEIARECCSERHVELMLSGNAHRLFGASRLGAEPAPHPRSGRDGTWNTHS